MEIVRLSPASRNVPDETHEPWWWGHLPTIFVGIAKPPLSLLRLISKSNVEKNGLDKHEVKVDLTFSMWSLDFTNLTHKTVYKLTFTFTTLPEESSPVHLPFDTTATPLEF